jgi:hypothetical protein
MTKTTLGNEYSFDESSFTIVMNSMEEELEVLVKNANSDSFELFKVHMKVVDRIATECLSVRLLYNQPVPFEDDEWLTLFHDGFHTPLMEKIKYMSSQLVGKM